MDRVGTDVYVGIDWGNESHQVTVLDAEGGVLKEMAIDNTGSALSDLGDELASLAEDPACVWVAIEVPRGPVVETLLERGITVFSINPKQLDRFRDRFCASGAKDDRRDAWVLADSLRTDWHCFRKLDIEEPIVLELREWSRMMEDLTQEHGQLSNRLRAQLRRYFVQYLELTNDVGSLWFLELWTLIPTPERARRVRKVTVTRLLRKYKIRRFNADEVLRVLRQRPLTVAPGTTEAATLHIELLVARLGIVCDQLSQCRRKLDALTKRICDEGAVETEEGDRREQSDGAILRSLPGVGRIVLATLLTEAARQLRDRDYQTLRMLSGVAPVTRSSGKQRRVLRRYACHHRLREAMYHWARVASQRDPWCKEMYKRHRARGKSHGRAVRGVGDRLLAVACAMLRDGTLYDPSRRKHAGQATAA